LDFDELTHCPGLVLGDLYSRFGYPRSPELEEILRDALAQSRTHRSEHSYQLGEMGFTREEIVREFSGIFSRFGFDTREVARIPVTESAATGEQESEPSLPKEPEYR
jgi:hypothetical protein